MDFKRNKIFRFFGILLIAAILISMISSFVSAETNDDSKKIRTEKISEIDNVASASESLYREKLNISKNVSIEPQSVEKLIERNVSDKENFEEIVAISKLAEPDEREDVANDLVNMNKYFVKKLANKAKESNESQNMVKQQIQKYVQVSANKTKLDVSMKEYIIRELFEKRVSAKQFIQGFLMRD